MALAEAADRAAVEEARIRFQLPQFVDHASASQYLQQWIAAAFEGRPPEQDQERLPAGTPAASPAD